MEIENQINEANMLGSALERYNLGVRDMNCVVEGLVRGGRRAFGDLECQLSDVDR